MNDRAALDEILSLADGKRVERHEIDGTVRNHEDVLGAGDVRGNRIPDPSPQRGACRSVRDSCLPGVWLCGAPHHLVAPLPDEWIDCRRSTERYGRYGITSGRRDEGEVRGCGARHALSSG